MDKLQNDRAKMKTVIGFARKKDEMYFFESERHGKIVRPASSTLEWEEWQALFSASLPGEHSTAEEAVTKLQRFLQETAAKGFFSKKFP